MSAIIIDEVLIGNKSCGFFLKIHLRSYGLISRVGRMHAQPLLKFAAKVICDEIKAEIVQVHIKIHCHHKRVLAILVLSIGARAHNVCAI